jgi:drug/metabolite transporter (DMT)-like permease
MWLTFALASSLLLAVRRVYEKELTTHFGNFSLSFALLIFAIPAVFVLLFFFPIPADISALPWRFWWPLIIIWLVLYPLQNYLLYRSLREGELSQVTPVSALLPVFNVLPSFMLIHELPSISGAVGIIVTVVATYLLLTDVRAGEKQKYNLPVLFMIGTVLCTAVGTTLDKIAIQVSTPVFYSFVNLVGASLVFLVLAFVYREQHEIVRIRKHFWTLAILGIIFALAFVAFTTAFALGPTSYTLAIRSGGFLIAALWGVLLLKESLSGRKVTALALFVAGTLFLAVG